jgi:hypothetical protein
MNAWGILLSNRLCCYLKSIDETTNLLDVSKLID